MQALSVEWYRKYYRGTLQLRCSCVTGGGGSTSGDSGGGSASSSWGRHGTELFARFPAPAPRPAPPRAPHVPLMSHLDSADTKTTTAEPPREFSKQKNQLHQQKTALSPIARPDPRLTPAPPPLTYLPLVGQTQPTPTSPSSINSKRQICCKKPAYGI